MPSQAEPLLGTWLCRHKDLVFAFKDFRVSHLKPLLREHLEMSGVSGLCPGATTQRGQWPGISHVPHQRGQSWTRRTWPALTGRETLVEKHWQEISVGLQITRREAWHLPALRTVDPEAQGGEGMRMESGPSRLQSPRPSKLPLPSLQVECSNDCAYSLRRSLGS